MSSIRIKEVRAPLAYVPVQQGQVAVVPTNDLPNPEHRDSPVNHEFLVDHARGLAGTSYAPAHSTPLSERAASPLPSTARPSTTRQRSKTLGALESGKSSTLTNTRFILPVLNPQRRSWSGSGSWFVDHVANSSINPLSGRTVPQKVPPQAPPTPLAQERSSTTSNATLEVIIPERVRAGLARTLQNENSSVTRLGDDVHSNDIVDHLSVIGTSGIQHFTRNTQIGIDAHIATVSHLSNAANSILM
jgi:hypothetical protein